MKGASFRKKMQLGLEICLGHEVTTPHRTESSLFFLLESMALRSEKSLKGSRRRKSRNQPIIVLFIALERSLLGEAFIREITLGQEKLDITLSQHSCPTYSTLQKHIHGKNLFVQSLWRVG